MDNRRGSFRGNEGPREMHKTVCADCGNECEVPFKPSGDKPVYCKECFRKHKKF
ncbi:MAG: DNA-directed RNA polymerase [Nanoarchaeota archaeon]|nr:DNA-directed RNA polymerase [Nanoarchaeota archaeon]